MRELLTTLRRTAPSGPVAGIRLFLGAMFVMAGVMKYTVPILRDAWSRQLIEAAIPFYTLNFWVVPLVEITVGIVLVRGFYARIAALVVMDIMIVATYVHMVTDDPTLFPLQPSEPIIPIVVIVLAAVVVIRGGGSGSMDLHYTESSS